MAETKAGHHKISTTIIAHKGEVVLVYSESLSNLNLSPQSARDLSQVMIHAAEQAEQQMDAERDKP